MKDRLSKLLSIKSLVTLILTLLFTYVVVRGDITQDQMMLIYTTVIAFYFGTQHEKKE